MSKTMFVFNASLLLVLLAFKSFTNTTKGVRETRDLRKGLITGVINLYNIKLATYLACRTCSAPRRALWKRTSARLDAGRSPWPRTFHLDRLLPTPARSVDFPRHEPQRSEDWAFHCFLLLFPNSAFCYSAAVCLEDRLTVGIDGRTRVPRALEKAATRKQGCEGRPST